ncbi:MAG: YdcF family protein, partial [Caulobacteraceae bacterium]|nr:YdcF family protein [Caulobacteraceae bacterium]
YHMPRAMVELEAAAPGVKVTPYPVATPDLDARRWLDNRRGAERMAKEYCKYLVALTRASLAGSRATGQT